MMDSSQATNGVTPILSTYLGIEIVSIPDGQDSPRVPSLPIYLSSGVYANGMLNSFFLMFMYVLHPKLK